MHRQFHIVEIYSWNRPVTHHACVPIPTRRRRRRTMRRRRRGAYSSRGGGRLPRRCPQLPRVLQQVGPPVITLRFAVVPSLPLHVRTTTAMRVMAVVVMLLLVAVMPKKAMRRGRRGGGCGATAIPWLCHVERHQHRLPTLLLLLLLLPPPLVLDHLHPQEPRCGRSMAASSKSRRSEICTLCTE